MTDTDALIADLQKLDRLWENDPDVDVFGRAADALQAQDARLAELDGERSRLIEAGFFATRDELARLRRIEEAAGRLLSRIESKEPPSFLKQAGDDDAIQHLRTTLEGTSDE